MNKLLLQSSVLLSLVALVGCAANGAENVLWSEATPTEIARADATTQAIGTTSSTGPSYTTSQVSAAAGAALGAGIGAVVGSATGNAVEGLAIGAVAGAASGALVGNEFQKRDEAIEQQREQISRQDETIQTQDRQIQDIRRSLEDRFPGNRPSARPKVSLDSYRGNPSAKPFSGAGITPRARMDSKTLATAATKSSPNYGGTLAASDISQRKDYPLPAGAVVNRNAKPQVAKVVSTSKVEMKKEIVKNEIPAAKKPIEPKREIARATPIVAGVVPATEKKKIAEAAKATVVAKKEVATSTVAKMTSAETTGCKEATEEARRGEEAISEADKLFYYRRAARLCPVQANYRVKIGQVYATLGKQDQAKGEFEKALEIDPENVIANEELSLLESNIAN